MMTIKNVPSALFFVLLLTRAIFGTCDNERTNSNCLSSERVALLTLKAGFVDPKNHLSSWEGHDCCSWRGVTCSNATGHVVKLDLGNTYGRIIQDEVWFADMSYALHGEIRSSMIFLQNLYYLDLSSNNFSRSKIPEFIGSLKELRYLSLAHSHFGGRIPPELHNLSNLQYLDLSWNNIYSKDVSWLADLSSLKLLDLSGVNLTDSINWEKLGTLSHLQALHLFYCGLNETSFSLSHVNFTELVTVDLSFNEFSNPVALNWIWNITCLKYLSFSANNFDGRLPNALRNMNSIEELYLGGNNLVDMKPNDLKNLTNLKFLDLSENKLIGDITEFIESLSPYRFQSLDLGENNLYGNLSGWIGRMTSLTTLSLSHNYLSGPIPLSIRTLTRLVELDLSDNNFHGEITENHLSRMSNLKKLHLSFNSVRLIVDAIWLPPFKLSYIDLSSCCLGPKFPEWLKWQTHVRFLYISNTSIADEVPVWFWHVFSKSRRLDLSKNDLIGPMPKSLEFMSITQLDLSENQFQGLIPKLPKNLYELDLSRNALSGFLPSNWKYLFLGSLNLKQNLLNDSIPKSICQLKHLVFLDLSHNFLVGNIPNCWRSNLNSTEKNYSRWWSSNESIVKPIALKSLILSHNNLSGEFPKHLKYFKSLIILNLHNNNFVGSVPLWIRKKLPSLRFLLLGSNRFNGTIPNQLFKLELLQLLDLSNNNLNGTLPRSSRSLQALTTIRDDIFESHDPFSIDVGMYPLTDAAPILIEVDTKGQRLDF
ncbi:Receptor-like kinase TMK2 [Rhynchospora pubera]|uniref:Receptor-like kinase TMK2 n=1 Tax=Rhynchospora pubera TaxID=906938 RepID=A0AAV8G074_9POAL|nr:Receptor-like kinase TMK2 [Rhynchospora pubera]